MDVDPASAGTRPTTVAGVRLCFICRLSQRCRMPTYNVQGNPARLVVGEPVYLWRHTNAELGEQEGWTGPYTVTEVGFGDEYFDGIITLDRDGVEYSVARWMCRRALTAPGAESSSSAGNLQERQCLDGQRKVGLP